MGNERQQENRSLKDETGSMGNALPNETLNYYDRNAEAFAAGTVGVPFTEIQDRFLALLPPGGKILDFGCGSGRDTKYFLEKGFSVDAADGSEEMCRYARTYTGIPVRKMLFSELSAVKEYDGIWACSSILHLPLPELTDVFQKMISALKKDGIIYTSFKYGDYTGMRNGRYFTDFTKESFETYIRGIENIGIKTLWITEDARPDRSNEKWLNLILQKAAAGNRPTEEARAE